MKEKIQILMIHGGTTFRNKKDYLDYLKSRKITLQRKPSWTEGYIDKWLGNKFEIIRPRMPFPENAKYEEWKINFERYVPLLRKNVILLGTSLGGIFLAKYLSENKFPKKIMATYLICPPFDDTCLGEDLGGGFKLKSDLLLLEKNSKNLTLIFSKDDDAVPIEHAEKYRNKLKNANIIIYKSKNGHFRVSEFPEIIRMIRVISKLF